MNKNMPIKRTKKGFFKNLLSFIFSISFLKNLGIAVLLLIVLSFATSLFLNNYTNHGEVISVPDFTGQQEDELAKLCLEKKLRYEIVDSLFIKSLKPGEVIEQIPKADSKVKENRTIFLTINAKAPEQVKIPNLVGASLIQAKADLEIAGLRIGWLTYVKDLAKNYVLEQRIDTTIVKAGTSVYKGTEINLVLGKGADDNDLTYIPNLVGLKVPVARQKAIDNFLNIKTVVYGRSIRTYQDSMDAVVWQQKPLRSRSIPVPYGKGIDLWLTIDSTKVNRDSTPEETDSIYYEIPESELEDIQADSLEFDIAD